MMGRGNEVWIQTTSIPNNCSLFDLKKLKKMKIKKKKVKKRIVEFFFSLN